MVVRYNRRWEEMDKSHTALDALFATYALYNRSEGTAKVPIRKWAKTCKNADEISY